MAKLLFIPVSILGGLVAGAVSRKIFDQIWGLFDEEAPPGLASTATCPGAKLAAAAVLQGAIFRADEGGHRTTTPGALSPATTGTWPGEKKPKPE